MLVAKMAKMEVDCNLKKLAHFKFVLFILEKSLTIDYITACFSYEKTLKTNFPILQEQFYFAKQVLCQIIEQLFTKIKQYRRYSAFLKESVYSVQLSVQN